jgi:hypothetical protein
MESTADITVTHGLLGAVDCRSTEGWQGAGESAAGSDATEPAQWSYQFALPPQEGFTLVCVGSPEQPTEIVIRAVDTA